MKSEIPRGILSCFAVTAHERDASKRLQLCNYYSLQITTQAIHHNTQPQVRHFHVTLLAHVVQLVLMNCFTVANSVIRVVFSLSAREQQCNLNGSGWRILPLALSDIFCFVPQLLITPTPLHPKRRKRYLEAHSNGTLDNLE